VATPKKGAGLLVLRSREYLYLNQFGQGTIKRIDFYGNVSASVTRTR
jgi:hypothetical protein